MATYSQDCKSLFVVTKDKFTKQDYLTGIPHIIENRGKKLTWRMSVDEFRGNPRYPLLTVSVSDPDVLNCIDYNAEIILLLENGKKLEHKNAAKYNCDGMVVFLFPTTGSDSRDGLKRLKTLSKTKVSAIRIPFSTGKYDFDLTSEQGKVMLESFQCALANAKK